MENYVTKEELMSDMSEPAIEGNNRHAEELINDLKQQGLMATELCYIAHVILEKYSDSSKRLIEMGKKSLSVIAEAEELLRSLQENK